MECYDFVEAALAPYIPELTCIISGGARGVDRLGQRFAKENDIHLEIYRADWDSYGKAAGYRRNVQMAEVADALAAFWDGESKGTGHMIDIATKRDLKVLVFAP